MITNDIVEYLKTGKYNDDTGSSFKRITKAVDCIKNHNRVLTIDSSDAINDYLRTIILPGSSLACLIVLISIELSVSID